MSKNTPTILEEFEGKFPEAKSNVDLWDGLLEPDTKNELRRWLASKLQEVEREKIILRSDLGRAIGRMQGLGYPDAYLEKRYPELAHLKEGEEEE